MYYESNELYHHGIKGMHWGIRRTPEQLGYRSSERSRFDEARAKAKEIKKQAKINAREIRAKAKEEAIIAKAKAKAQALLNKEQEKKQDKINKASGNDSSKKSDSEKAAEKLEKKKNSFFGQFKDNAIKPAVVNAGKDVIENWLKKFGKETLGITDANYEKIKKEADMARMKLETAENKERLKSVGKKDKENKELREAQDKAALSRAKLETAENEHKLKNVGKKEDTSDLKRVQDEANYAKALWQKQEFSNKISNAKNSNSESKNESSEKSLRERLSSPKVKKVSINEYLKNKTNATETVQSGKSFVEEVASSKSSSMRDRLTSYGANGGIKVNSYNSTKVSDYLRKLYDDGEISRLYKKR